MASSIKGNVKTSSLIQMFGGGGSGGGDKGSLVRVRSRKEMEDLVERMKMERLKEVVLLGELQRVSRFAHRGRIQSMLKLRFLRKDLVIQDQAWSSPKRTVSERLQNRFSILFLRERFDNRNQNDENKIPVIVRSRKVDDQSTMESQDSVSAYSAQSNLVYNQVQDRDQDQDLEVISISDSECSSPRSSSPQFRSEDILQEGSNILELNLLNSGSGYLQKGNPGASWDKSNSWENNIDLQSETESPNSSSWQSESEFLTVELESYTHQGIIGTGYTWVGDPSHSISWRGAKVKGQEYHDLVETFSDKSEIRELLQRRTVTTSLASDFRDKMNKMLLKILLRRGQQHNDDDDFAKECGEGPTWGHNYAFNSVFQFAPDSSLVSSPCQTVRYSDNWRNATLSNDSSNCQLESEVVHDLKNEITHMREEISELRKMVDSCIEGQAKLQSSRKEEVLSSVHQPVPISITSEFSDGKHNCCICNEMQVDSLLYRCGHICTCFRCAHEVQRKNGVCPVCQALILDIVRVHPNSG